LREYDCRTVAFAIIEYTVVRASTYVGRGHQRRKPPARQERAAPLQIWYRRAIARTANNPNNKPPKYQPDIMISNLKKLEGADVITTGAGASFSANG
jgi:hypothetical protein